MKKKAIKQKVVTIRTSQGLRDTLFDELDMLRNGESEPFRAAAVAKLAVQIINTAMLEVHLSRTDMAINQPNDAIRVRPIKLGNTNGHVPN
jgi:hypothetical protein